MTRRLSIACDVDGVLGDFVGALCFKLQELGLEVRSEDIKHWDLRKALGIVGPVAERLAKAPRFARLIDPYPGAIVAYLKLAKMGDVFALTAPMTGSPDWYESRAQWLVNHFNIHEGRIAFLTGPEKWRFKADILVEDHPKNAAMWCEANPNGQAFIIDRPWNGREADCYTEQTRMHRTTLEELPELVNLIAEDV